MELSLNNQDKQRRKILLTRIFTISAIVLTVCAAVMFFLPFVTFQLNKTRYTFTLLTIAIGFMRVKGTVVALPFIVKVIAAMAPFTFLAGSLLLVLKKARAASICFMLGAITPLIVLMAGNSITSIFVDLGISAITISYHVGFAVMFLLGILTALLAMMTRGAEKFAQAVFQVFACLSVGAVILITLYMIVAGVPAISEIGFGKFLLGTKWNPDAGRYGILYMILTSILGTFGAIVIGVPIGLFTAVFLAEMAPRRLAGIVRPAVELLAGIPSVIYGFFGMIIIVPAIRAIFSNTFGDSLLAMIIILAIMILPTIVSVSETALRAVPPSYKEASLALGNTHIGTIFQVLVPAAKSGVLSGIILGVGRAIGETMAVVMVCGNVVQFPELLRSVRPLTAGVVLEMSYASGLHRQALFSIGLVLFLFVMIVNITFTIISKRGVKIDGRE